MAHPPYTGAVTARCPRPRGRIVRLLAALLVAVPLGLLAVPAAHASYVPVLPPATESAVDPEQPVDDGPGAAPTRQVDSSAPPAIARLSYTGVQAGALALTGLALVAAGAAAVNQSRTRRGWH